MATVLERNLTSIETVDLSTLGGAELPALAALVTLKQQAVVTYEQMTSFYGRREYDGSCYTMRAFQLLLVAIDLLDHHIRGE